MNLAIVIAAISSAFCAWNGQPAAAVVLLVLLLVASGLRRLEQRLDGLDERLDEIEAALVVK